MTTLPVNPGDTITQIAQQQLGDWRRWREIADLNGLDAITALPVGDIQIPELRSAAQLAKPLLTNIAAGRNGGGNLSALIQNAADLAGYGKAAQVALGVVNGVLGEVESVGGDGSDRGYQQAGVQLVDWLLQ